MPFSFCNRRMIRKKEFKHKNAELHREGIYTFHDAMSFMDLRHTILSLK